jgi:hypothetical protein
MSVDSVAWMAPGLNIWIQNAFGWNTIGYFRIVSIDAAAKVVTFENAS